MNPLRLSVAIPIYNEAPLIPELLRRLTVVLGSVAGGPHEIVIVDDGSMDGSGDALIRAAGTEPRLTVVTFSRNFGHQAALSAALDHCTGDAVVLMDGDLQDPPEAIPELVRTHLEGYDVVYAKRVRRKEGWLLRLCYAMFYRILARLSNIQLPVDAGDFGLMSRRVVEQLRKAPERRRYLRGLRAWAGYRQIGIAIERSARAGGESKYSMTKLIALACDGFFSFSVAPLRAAALLGAGAIALSSIFALYSIVAKFLWNRSPQGFTALIVVMVFLSGTNLLFLGLLGEYLGRVYEEVKRRPLYVVDQVIRASVREPTVRPAAVVAELHR
jgi:glycosyltransferase involved in cell wall biosynthesis